jgi:hypothetical protein
MACVSVDSCFWEAYVYQREVHLAYMWPCTLPASSKIRPLKLIRLEEVRGKVKKDDLRERDDENYLNSETRYLVWSFKPDNTAFCSHWIEKLFFRLARLLLRLSICIDRDVSISIDRDMSICFDPDIDIDRSGWIDIYIYISIEI